MKNSLYWAYILAALVFATIEGTLASSDQHFITNSNQFVIINSDQPQLYRIFGLLPYIRTRSSQIYLGAVLLVCLGLPLSLFLYLRPRHPYANWTSKLPNWALNWLFLLETEYITYKQIIVGEMMALLGTPMGVGLDIAASLSMWNPLSSNSKQHRRDLTDGSMRRNGRSMLRRGNAGLNSIASTSRLADRNVNAIGGEYYNGLFNTGNSCFLNSTLQSLASLDILQKYLESVMSLAELWDVPTPVTDALYDLMIDLNTPLVKRGALLPRQLTEALSNLPRTNVGSFFYAHQQQDAHELLVLLTSAIDDEVTTIFTERDYMIRREAFGLRAAMAPSLPSLYTSSSYASTSTNPFRSLIAQRTACLDCGYVEAVRHYPADELSLGVPYRGASSAVTLELCLRNWSKLERVEWICFRCSLSKTLEKIQNDVRRMIGSHTANGHASPDAMPIREANGTAAISNGSSGKMTNSKRKRIRELKRKEAVLTSIIDEHLSEDEVEHILEKADIKLEKIYSNLASKQVMIARTPQVLTIHLNRSNYSASNFGASKNNTPVLFDEFLNVTEVVTNGELNMSGSQPISRGSTPARELPMRSLFDNDSNNKINGNNGYLGHPASHLSYRLCAIVVHYGSHSSGHYVSFRRRSLKGPKVAFDDDIDDHSETQEYHAWSRISDDSVSPCSIRSVLSQNPFILFYERIDDENSDARLDDQELQVGLNGTGDNKLAIIENKIFPSGFEIFGKDKLQQKISTYRPRVVERWNTSVY